MVLSSCVYFLLLNSVSVTNYSNLLGWKIQYIIWIQVVQHDSSRHCNSRTNLVCWKEIIKRNFSFCSMCTEIKVVGHATRVWQNNMCSNTLYGLQVASASQTIILKYTVHCIILWNDTDWVFSMVVFTKIYPT